ncbi:MAG TPA: hypothetical protein VGX23_04155 [Actinocrinis sp.]|nr:hypothetical protein [Actinocrinis sp.]
MTEPSESTRQSDQQSEAGPDAPAAQTEPAAAPPAAQADTPVDPAAAPEPTAPAVMPTPEPAPTAEPAAKAVPAPAPAAPPAAKAAPAPAPAAPAKPAEKPTVYRGGAAFIGGLIVVVLSIAGIIDLLIEGGSQDLIGDAVLALLASLAFAYGIYPAAYTTADRLRVRNPVRTIVMPWSTVTEVTAKLSFVVHTEQRRYTVWAIPVSLTERRKAERNRLKEISRADRDARRAMRGTTRLSDIQVPSSRRTDPIERLSYADQALKEMADRREAYRNRAKNAPDLHQNTPPATSWAWPVVLSVGISVVLVVLAAVL